MTRDVLWLCRVGEKGHDGAERRATILHHLCVGL